MTKTLAANLPFWQSLGFRMMKKAKMFRSDMTLFVVMKEAKPSGKEESKESYT